MLYCEARRPARRTSDGGFVPLSAQDTRLWLRPMMAEAEFLLFAASRVGQVGRFQLEAAIQSGHAERAWGSVAPSVGASLGHAAAVAEAQGAERGLALLEEIPQHLVANHQPYWALRGQLLRSVDRPLEAWQAYERAISFTEDRAISAFLCGRLVGAMEQFWDEALERLRREIERTGRANLWK